MTIYADNGDNSRMIIDTLYKFVDFDIVYDVDTTNLLCQKYGKLPIIEIDNKYFNFYDAKLLFGIGQ